MALKSFLVASLAGLSGASPMLLQREVVTVTETVPSAAAPTATAWDAGAVPQIPIHNSCNATERAQLESGLNDMLTLAAHAKAHILRYGNSSVHYTRWFGNAPSATPIGWYERVLSADRADMLFRCDDPDGNCGLHPDTWAGHWRGENATQETVICPRSFSGIRWSLDAMCGRGYTVANSAGNSFFGTDLLHRVLHVPRISENVVDHFAGDYPEMMELAKTHPEEAVINSDTIQLFAVDVYAYDVAVPGVGCHGEYVAEEPTAAPSSTPAAQSTAAPASSATPSETPSVTDSAPNVSYFSI